MRRILLALARAMELLSSVSIFAGGVIRWPFDAIGGPFGGRPMPYFNEGEQPDVRLSRLFTEEPKLDTGRVARADAYTQVRDYIRKPHMRCTVDLSSVRQEVLDVLMSMTDEECTALSRAGDSKIRLFADGQNHGVFGVPHAGMQTSKTAPDVPKVSVVESLQERLQRKLANMPFEVPKVA